MSVCTFAWDREVMSETTASVATFVTLGKLPHLPGFPFVSFDFHKHAVRISDRMM